jgi:hypothetical protein
VDPGDNVRFNDMGILPAHSVDLLNIILTTENYNLVSGDTIKHHKIKNCWPKK